MIVRFKKLSPEAQVPVFSSPYAAGADICALNGCDTEIAPGETVILGTGLALEIPEGFAGLIFARSGLASKTGLAPANKVGVIDSDYRGELKVALHNGSTVTASVHKGDRIAQLVITPVPAVEYVEADELSYTVRGEGGFGSTGK